MKAWSIGSSPNEQLTVTVLSFPKKDKNFAYKSVEANIHIAIGGFVGDYRTAIPFEDLIQFREQLVAIHRDLKGTAELSQIMERQIQLKVEMDGHGHYSAKGEAIDNIEKGNKLSFQFRGDQTELGQTIIELNSVIDECQ